MANTRVVVGAGPGVEMGVARAFRRRGFRVGLIARTKEKLDALVGERAGSGIAAAAPPPTSAIARAARRPSPRCKARWGR